jgi:hypothetical protein
MMAAPTAARTADRTAVTLVSASAGWTAGKMEQMTAGPRESGMAVMMAEQTVAHLGHRKAATTVVMMGAA